MSPTAVSPTTVSPTAVSPTAGLKTHQEQQTRRLIAKPLRYAGNVLFNDALNTFYLQLYGRKEEVFYLTMHSRHFIYGYMALDIW